MLAPGKRWWYQTSMSWVAAGATVKRIPWLLVHTKTQSDPGGKIANVVVASGVTAHAALTVATAYMGDVPTVLPVIDRCCPAPMPPVRYTVFPAQAFRVAVNPVARVVEVLPATARPLPRVMVASLGCPSMYSVLRFPAAAV